MMTLAHISHLVSLATQRGTSHFYRDLYRIPPDVPALEIRSWDEWRALPLLTKDDLLKVPLLERAFPPLSNMHTVVASSGTSGKPPLFSSLPLLDGFVFRSEYHTFSRATLASLPTPHKKEWEIQRRDTGRVVTHDPKRTRASVLLAKAAGVDSLIVFLFHIPAIAEEMAKLGMLGDIRYIEVAGEACSRSMYEFIRKTFPNAIITSEYGSTDVEATPIGTPCHPMDGTEPLEVFHTSDRFYLELLDYETGQVQEIKQGAEGDLAITALASESPAFPLIRYRHGDAIRVVENACKEHGEWSFQVLGRRDADFVKVPGGVLRVDEVARVLRSMGLSDDFQIRIHEDTWHGKPGARIVLSLPLVGSDAEHLAPDIASKIRIGHSYTLADAAKDGICRPLSCERAQDSHTQEKRKRIVRG